MNDQYEFSGKTVEDAIANGLNQLNLTRDQVDIEVVNKGSRGILGFGSEAAIVRMMPRATSAALTETATVESASETFLADTAVSEEPEEIVLPNKEQVTAESIEDDPLDDEEAYDDDDDDAEITDEELAEMAVDLLAEMVALMGLDAEVTSVWKDPEPGDHERCLQLDIHGDDLGSLIGYRGETLSSVQFLLRLMVNQKIHAWQNIVVDVDNYKAKRAKQLVEMVKRMVAQVVETGRAISLEPMPSNERRIVHLSLRDHPDVYTESSGESDRRKVHIIPRD